jgi:hypothetical protein
MRFDTRPHQWDCGIDLHTRTMYVCMPDQDGEVVMHRNMKAQPDALLKLIALYREDIVGAVECIFTWYWLADLCASEGLPFVLGHALSMKAIPGGKAKNGKIDAQKIAVLLRGGRLPHTYVYPAEMRAPRDWRRRRMSRMRQRADLLTHAQQTNSQDRRPEIGPPIASKANREGGLILLKHIVEKLSCHTV